MYYSNEWPGQLVIYIMKQHKIDNKCLDGQEIKPKGLLEKKELLF